MDTAAHEELRALRARAYGPDADIDQDPAAMRRLRELEARRVGSTERASVDVVTPSNGMRGARQSASPPGHGESVRGAMQDATPEPGAGESPTSVAEAGGDSAGGVPARVAEAGGVPVGGGATAAAAAARPGDGERAPDNAVAEDAAGAHRPVRRVSRRVSALWAISVVAAAALGSGITFWATSMAPVSVSSGAPQIATLEPDSLVEIPAGWFGAGPSSRAWEFFGLTLFETSQGFTMNGTDCFVVMPTEQLPAEDADPNNWSINGAMYSGCRVGSFPATVEVPVDSGMPVALRDRFPPDSALQFVLEGERIGVFLDSD